MLRKPAVAGTFYPDNPEECSYCEVCMDVCPNECIKIEDDF